MTYQHCDKAGNPGDVVKHAFLAELVSRRALAWAADDADFIYLETHSGPAAHLLTPGGEWEEGLGALDASEAPGLWEGMVLRDGLVPAAEAEGYQPYPGSSLLTLTVLRARGLDPYLTLSELDPGIAAELEASYRTPELLGGDASSVDLYKIVVLAGDGYANLSAALRELPRPAFVFIDPPAFEAIQVQRAMENCDATGVPVLAWLPIIADPDELPPEVSGLVSWCAETGRQTFRCTWPRKDRQDRCTRGCLLAGSGFSDEDWIAAKQAVTSLKAPPTWTFD